MLLLNPEGVLDLLHIQLRDPFVRGVAILILVKVWLLMLLIAYVTYRRTLRMISRLNNETRYLNHLRLIFNYVHSQGADKFHIPFYDRLFVRRLIIVQMSVMEGEEKDWLKNLYKEAGYFDEDLKSLKSNFYWVRLAAVVRLESGNYNELVPVFTSLIEDSNDFVSIVSMRALSRLDGCGPLEPILDALSRRAPARRDVFVEILQNLGGEQPEEILHYLETCYDPHTASICIDVLGQLEFDDAFQTILRLYQSIDDAVVLSVAQALGKLQNPRGIDALQLLTEHQNPTIRAAALRSLVTLQSPRLSWVVQRLKSDHAVEVRRALFELQAEGLPA